MKKKLVNVIGLGYIGLPTAALLASNGYTVIGTDINGLAVETINQGKIHIVEPGLAEVVQSVVKLGRLKAYTSPQPADIYIICVPTPFYEGGDIPLPNIEYVITAIRSIAKFIKDDDIIILESTSPVGTIDQIREVLLTEAVAVENIKLAYCPERVLPGRILEELVENDRVVGGVDFDSSKIVAEFYRSFVNGYVHVTDARTAEMCKLTENSFRDVNIAFANELSIICDREGIDVWNLIRLANHHPRVSILQPGVGVGGHCIAVDPWFIVARHPEYAKIIRSAREINNNKTNWVLDKIKATSADLSVKSGKVPAIACLGLAFKPDIDDLRESPALHVALTLEELGYELVVVEPNINLYPMLKIMSLDEAIERADIVVIMVRHKEFLDPEFARRLKVKIFLDFCGALSNH